MTGCRNIHALLHGNITHDPSACLGINTTRSFHHTAPITCVTIPRIYLLTSLNWKRNGKSVSQSRVPTDLRYQSRPLNFRFHADMVCGVSECLLFSPLLLHSLRGITCKNGTTPQPGLESLLWDCVLRQCKTNITLSTVRSSQGETLTGSQFGNVYFYVHV